jgi:hypothetical protein
VTRDRGRRRSGHVADGLLVDADRPLQVVAGGDVHDADALDDERGARRQPLELLVEVQLVELLAVAAQQDEAVEIAAVRLEEPDLEALDAAVLLESAVVREPSLKTSRPLASRPVMGAPQPMNSPPSAMPCLLGTWSCPAADRRRGPRSTLRSRARIAQIARPARGRRHRAAAQPTVSDE